VAGLLALCVVGILALQRLLVFPRFAMRTPASDAGAGVLGLDRWWIDLDGGGGGGGGRVEAWFLPGNGVSAERPGPLVIFAHGNGELIDFWPDALAPYREMGVSVLLPEYRGYGRSAGSPSEKTIASDFVAFHDLAVARPEVSAARVVLHGRSIGGGAVCALAAQRRPAALVLQSTFTSLADVTRRFLLPRFLVLDPFDNVEVVRALDAPVLVVHGRTDTLIPPAHAEALARAAGARGRLAWFDGGHNDTPEPRLYWEEVRRFLADSGLL